MGPCSFNHTSSMILKGLVTHYQPLMFINPFIILLFVVISYFLVFSHFYCLYCHNIPICIQTMHVLFPLNLPSQNTSFIVWIPIILISELINLLMLLQLVLLDYNLILLSYHNCRKALPLNQILMKILMNCLFMKSYII